MEAPSLIADIGFHTVKSGLSPSPLPLLFPSQLSCQHLHDITIHDVTRPLISDVINPQTSADQSSIRFREPSSSVPSSFPFDPSQPHDNPIQHRVFTDWEKIEKIWERIFKETGAHPQETPILNLESPENPKENQEKMTQLLFERFAAGGYFPGIQAVMSLYAVGRITGLVLESGDVVTYVLPVSDGYAISPAITRHDFGGHDLTIYLASLLREKGVNFSGPLGFETVQSIKEEHSFISLDFKEEFIPAHLSEIERSFPLPDGNLLTLGSERFRCPEILFQPSILGRETPGLAELMHSSIMKCDIDLRLNLYSNMVLSGGNTLFRGIEDRLTRELRELAPSTVRPEVVGLPERKYLAWRGGAVFAGMEGFRKICISREQYNEVGPNVVHRMQL